MKIKPEIKEKWLKALRSGEYKQTTSVLASKMSDDKTEAPTNFCCLGVLCDIYLKENNESWNLPDDISPNVFSLTHLGELGHSLIKTSPPVYVRDWVMQEDKGPVEFGDLASKNDKGYSFQMIADIIEKDM